MKQKNFTVADDGTITFKGKFGGGFVMNSTGAVWFVMETGDGEWIGKPVHRLNGQWHDRGESRRINKADFDIVLDHARVP